MIELIGTAREATEGIEALHIADEILPAPGHLLAGHGEIAGRMIHVEQSQIVVHGEGFALVHRGEPQGSMPHIVPPDVTEWAVLTFFDDAIVRAQGGIQTATLDGLRRWCELPPPANKTCQRCGGRRHDPQAVVRDDGLVAACLRCDGDGTEIDESGFDRVGPVTVDRRVLAPVLQRLRGDEVALFWAPEVGGFAPEVHIRAHERRRVGTQYHLVWGDWRLLLYGVPRRREATADAG